MGDNNPKRSNGEKNLMRGMEIIKKLNSFLNTCCYSNKPVYLVTYTIGTKWKVCHECIELEIFNSGIVKKERVE